MDGEKLATIGAPVLQWPDGTGLVVMEEPSVSRLIEWY